MHHQNTVCKRKTAWITSELYYWHDTLNWCGFLPPSLHVQPGDHFEHPETKRRFENLVRATALDRQLTSMSPNPVSNESLLAIHPQSQIDHIESVCKNGGGDTGLHTPAGANSSDIARLAAGGVITAIDAVMEKTTNNAYVLCRPPGHHALPEKAMGFCLYANAAIGIKYAMDRYNISRVCTVDWDVHHGNGTEAIFIDDPDVLTISLHQDNLFPQNSGSIKDSTGSKANLNIPLPPGSGSGAYRHAFTECVIPALNEFKPELIVVPCGFDASALDPLGVQMLSSEDFRWMMRQVLSVADTHCHGRVVATHEGGYSASYVPYCGIAVLEEMAGASSTLPDPFYGDISNYGGQALGTDQRSAIENAKLAFSS